MTISECTPSVSSRKMENQLDIFLFCDAFCHKTIVILLIVFTMNIDFVERLNLFSKNNDIFAPKFNKL